MNKTMNTTCFMIEGLDRLGKGTLIQGIKDQWGFYQVIHFQKPEQLFYYVLEEPDNKDETWFRFRSLPESSRMYQFDSFLNMFSIIGPKSAIICDRAHLGEVVYSKRYRGYDGSYVYDLEKQFLSNDPYDQEWLKLILLTEDFSVSKHFVDDGESFDVSKRHEEQRDFIEAFNRSIIKHKKIVCVTDKKTGEFRPALDILEEALS